MRFGILVLLSSLVFAPAAFAAKKPTLKAPPKSVRGMSDIIEKNHRDFDRCAQAEQLRAKKKPRGVVLVRYTVNGDGKVNDAGAVHNTTKSRPLADCLVRTLERIHFPPTFGPPVTSAHPFKYLPPKTKKKP